MSLWYIKTIARVDNPAAQKRDQLIHVCFLPIQMRDLEARKVEDFGDGMREVAIRGVSEAAKSDICKVPEYFVRLFAFIQGFDTLKYR